ncbi:hypothetical protein SLS62_011020 [Diatrype stigma]|uniref:SWIRM domain-containing protein n=1 Tax=Diatrype stigma TaxID=117547 RepID=A0AAN9YFI7_9PEZI
MPPTASNPASTPTPTPTSTSTSTSTLKSNSPEQMESNKKLLDISNLMSPPEPPRLESFLQENNMKGIVATSDVRRVPGPIPPLSPPISPATKAADHMARSTISTSRSPARDPILYPAHDITGSPHQQPLFIHDDSQDIQRIVDDHLVARPASLFTSTTPPRPEHYELMLSFKSDVMKKYNEDPKGWLLRERAQLIADRKASARRNHFKLQPILPAKPQPIRTHAQRVVKPAKVSKNVSPPRPIRSNLPAAPSISVAHRVSPAPDQSSRRMVAPNREDKDFESLPNYCPPTSSLPNKPNSLKVDWKGAPIDLSGDAHRHLLHPDEVSLAANLRLDCATYLTSKRRMFIRRLECLRVGKEFRKTDAQQACKIDVNKASKLWTAFEKVGWLDKDWMQRYI